VPHSVNLKPRPYREAGAFFWPTGIFRSGSVFAAKRSASPPVHFLFPLLGERVNLGRERLKKPRRSGAAKWEETPS
jgi:hypothetical protein